MPTYEYKCLDCGKRFEVFQKMTDEPLTECDACKGRLKRLIGAGAGIIFKGSGFYCTDYRSDSYRQGVSKASKSDSSTTSKDKTSTASDSAGSSSKSSSTESKKP